MNDGLVQFVLGQGNGGAEGIIQILIFVFFIVVAIIKSLFAAKQEQKRNQMQKKPNQRTTPRKSPDTAEKIRMQRERYEQFLENILQPKKSSQQKSSAQKPQSSEIAQVSNAKKSPPVTKVYTSPSGGIEPYRNVPPKASYSDAESYIDKKDIEMPAMDTKIEHIPQFKEEHIQEDQQHLIYHDRPRKQKGNVTSPESTDSLLNFSDSEDLKKAILYTEILGRPICLRETEALFD